MPLLQTIEPKLISRYSDFTLLLVRAVAGAFLVLGLGFGPTAPLIIWLDLFSFLGGYVQVICGVLLVLGLLTRWAGLIAALILLTSLGLAAPELLQAWWPALLVSVVGIDCAARGGGRYSIDALLRSKSARTATDQATAVPAGLALRDTHPIVQPADRGAGGEVLYDPQVPKTAAWFTLNEHHGEPRTFQRADPVPDINALFGSDDDRQPS